MKQLVLFGKQADFQNQKDVVYTPKWVVKDILNWLSPAGSCLDPCRGNGAFYNEMDNAEYCELEEDKDFFCYNKPVNWIIGNPPYSIFEEWLKHSFKLANNVAYLVPTNKVFQRLIIMRMINIYGGIYGMRIYGSGNNINFPFGFSVGCFHFKKGWKGLSTISFPMPNKLLKQMQG